MDTPKIRLIAGIGAAFFGFAGIGTFAAAGAVLLEPVLGLAWSIVTVASIFMSLALVCGFIFLDPTKSSEEEMDDFEHATAETLADLPFETMKVLLEKRPLTVAAIAAFAGYSLIKNPESMSKNIQKIIATLL